MSGVSVIQKSITPFLPTMVGGCRLWLDGADATTITLTTGNVTSVREKANSATFTNTGTVTQTTIGTQSAFSFGGSSYLSGSVNSFLTGTAFIVFKATATNNGYTPFFTWRDNAGQQNFPAFGYVPGGNTIAPYTTFVGAGTPTTAVSIGTSYLASYSWTGTTTAVSFNGATPTAGTQSAYASTETLMWIAYDNGSTLTAAIGEIILYNTVLGQSDRQKVEGYLAWKWGLQASLATGQPYLTAAPTIAIPAPTVLIIPQNKDGRITVKYIAKPPSLPLITTGLVNRWFFSEGSGTTVADSVGGQTATLYGSPTWVTGNTAARRAVYFANTIVSPQTTNQYGLTSTGGTVTSTFSQGTWTFTIWINPRTYILQGADVFFAVSTSGSRYFNFYIANSSGNINSYNGFGGSGILSANTTGSCPLNTWTHIAIVSSSTSVTVYFNGTAGGTGTWPSYTIPSSGFLCFGAENVTGTYGVNMYMDDARLYTRALSSTEIASIVAGTG